MIVIGFGCVGLLMIGGSVDLFFNGILGIIEDKINKVRRKDARANELNAARHERELAQIRAQTPAVPIVQQQAAPVAPAAATVAATVAPVAATANAPAAQQPLIANAPAILNQPPAPAILNQPPPVAAPAILNQPPPVAAPALAILNQGQVPVPAVPVPAAGQAPVPVPAAAQAPVPVPAPADEDPGMGGRRRTRGKYLRRKTRRNRK